MPGVRYADNKISASSFEALGLSVNVSRAFVPQVVVDVVSASRKVHRVDYDLAGVQATAFLSDVAVNQFIIFGGGQVRTAANNADGFHFQ